MAKVQIVSIYGNYLKLFILLVLLICFHCKHDDSRLTTCPPPDFVRFVVLDNQGRNIIDSPDTTLSITYNKNGVVTKAEIQITKFTDSSYDTAKSKKYSGMCIRSMDMSFESAKENVKNFSTSINGTASGMIFYDCQQTVPFDVSHSCYFEKAFTFKGYTVATDNSVFPPVGVVHL